MTDSEKIQRVINALGLTAYSLSIRLNYSSPQTVYHIVNGVNSLSHSFTDRLLNKFPNVNTVFLREGKGEVLLTGEALKNQLNLLNISEDYLNSNEFLGLKIKEVTVEEKKNNSSDFISVMSEFSDIPEKLNKLIALQEENNELLKQLLSK